MNPADNSPESPKQPDSSAAPKTEQLNGAGKPKSGIWPFDGPQPYKLTPEEIQSLMQLWDEEDEKEAAAGLREILEGRGVSSEELFRAIDKVIQDNG